MSSSNLANVPLDCRPLAAACDSMIHDVLLSVRRRRWVATSRAAHQLVRYRALDSNIGLVDRSEVSMMVVGEK